MRMMDWSSDVCSSDLPGDFAKAEGGSQRLQIELIVNDVGRQHRSHAKGPFHRKMVEPDRAIEHGNRDATVETEPIIGVHIGRASCRERVRPDGRISGVLVTFKKQKNK